MTEKEIREKAEEVVKRHYNISVHQVDSIASERLSNDIFAALAAAHRQGREDERAFFKKMDDSKWHDAEHCSCLGHAIHMAEKHADNPNDGCDCSLIAGEGNGDGQPKTVAYSQPHPYCQAELERVVGELRKAMGDRISDEVATLNPRYAAGHNDTIAAFDRRCGELGVKINP